MARIPKKREYFLAKAREKGRIQAQLEMHRKKPLEESAKEHIGHILDNVQIDPLKLLAIGGATIFIHNYISSNPGLLQAIMTIPEAASLTAESIAEWATFPFGMIFMQAPKPTGKFQLPPDWMVWLGSFFIAYILINHAGQLIGLLDKGLGSIIPLILGIGGL